MKNKILINRFCFLGFLTLWIFLYFQKNSLFLEIGNISSILIFLFFVFYILSSNFDDLVVKFTINSVHIVMIYWFFFNFLSIGYFTLFNNNSAQSLSESLLIYSYFGKNIFSVLIGPIVEELGRVFAIKISSKIKFFNKYTFAILFVFAHSNQIFNSNFATELNFLIRIIYLAVFSIFLWEISEKINPIISILIHIFHNLYGFAFFIPIKNNYIIAFVHLIIFSFVIYWFYYNWHIKFLKNKL